MNVFKKAVREKSKARVALIGPSGSGKTFSALRLAKGLNNETEKTAFIDTENSGELFSDLYNYDIVKLEPPFTPQRLIDLINVAAANNYACLIIDSLTHFWTGEGGLLDLHDDFTKADKFKNSFNAWRKVTPLHNRLVDTLIRYPGHVIITLRTKTAYEIQEQEYKGNRKKIPIKIGLAPQFREGIEYEFTVAFDINHDHYATVSKDRTNLFLNMAQIIDEEIGVKLSKWLNSGVEPVEPIAETRQVKQKAIQKKADKAAKALPDWVVEIMDVAKKNNMPKEVLSSFKKECDITDFEKANQSQIDQMQSMVNMWLTTNNDNDDLDY